jgi:glycosyltransferase involved in cell wall biosynthesis
MSHMVSQLAPHFPQMRVADISEGDAVSWLRPAIKLRRSASAWWSIPGSDAVYIAVKAGQGMWLTAAAAALARVAGARVFLHHHSYAYVRERKPRMVVLTRAAGPHAHHIVLSESMASDLSNVMPEIHRPLVVGNAGLVDRTLLELPLKADGGYLVLGHLSNLTLEKGIAEVVDLASALHQAGTPVRLVVGGPTLDGEARLHLNRAARELGESFEYRGPLTGEAKRAFFEVLTHFVFPSRYVHEAAPLVLYEAMAAGAVCVATRQGSIPEQLQGSPSVLAQSADSFVEETLPALVDASVSAAASQKSRQVYLRALSEFETQLAGLVTLLARQ